MIQSRTATLMLVCALLVSACGGDKKDSDERDKEVQKAIQEGVQKEKQMMEGIQKGVETLEKKVEEQTRKK